MLHRFVIAGAICAGVALGSAAASASAADAKTALFGDLHVHTRYSFDAYLFGTLTSPDDAYRFAKGEAVPHAGGFDLQLDRPLDFLAVTDHAAYLGVYWAWRDPEHPAAADADVKRCVAPGTVAQRSAAKGDCAPTLAEKGRREDSLSAWRDIQAAAERHNAPGAFTTFIGYEYTPSRPSGLHRNVYYRGSKAPPLPFSRLDSPNPEDLWNWMDAQRAQGIDAIAIPHNANLSGGNMFGRVKFAGEALTAAYAEQRMRNEPLVEITQVKGTSDTHPLLSPNDEWADFEVFGWGKESPPKMGKMGKMGKEPAITVSGSYVRGAWLNGLAMERGGGFNPYRFGVVGASDSHNAGERFDERQFVGKTGLLDSTPERRGSVPLGEGGFPDTVYRFFSASGLAGVWAKQNTREAIFDALRRKETFATTGPRIKVRLFAGYGFDAKMVDAADLLQRAAAKGVPQGADLAARENAAPAFLAWATADPLGTRLQRLQVIKGWVAGGKPHEKVYDVACSDGLAVDAETHRCPDNGAKVDTSNCSITKGVGAAELRALWRDPEFDPDHSAFYYVRALENPTCRWSTWDAARAGTTPRPDVSRTIQERAWSSPIWVR